MVMFKVEARVARVGKDWETGLVVDRIGRPVVGADVIEAFVKPRSRPEPNLGSKDF